MSSRDRGVIFVLSAVVFVVVVCVLIGGVVV